MMARSELSSMTEEAGFEVQRARQHKWLAGARGLVLLATSVTVAQFGSGAASAAPGPDTIQYRQTTGSGGTYIQYVPGNGSSPTNESITSGGGCATPSPSGVPILQFSAMYYPSGYTGGSVAAVVGAYKSRTGVCQISPAWGIEQNESLIFSVGSNNLVKGRLFTAASLQLAGNDKSGVPTQVQLIESLAGRQVGHQNISSALPQGTAFTASTGSLSTGFDQLEIRTLSPSTGSVSVVGPSSTFVLGSP